MKTNSLVLALFVLSACGGGLQECKVEDPKTCSGGAVCEKVTGKEKTYCFQPVQITGKVTVLGATTPIANAEVSAVDVNGAPVGPGAKSATDGSYALRIIAERSDEKGTPIGRTVSLRASAQDFIPFPSGVRVSLPVDTKAATAASADKPYILTSSQTDIGLTPIPDGEKGRPSVSGTVELAAGSAALVVLEGNGKAYSTSPDSTGAFRIFNVAAGGGYRAQAYSKGVNYAAVDVTVITPDTTGVELKKTSAMTATMQGSISLVAGANGAGTSVVMVIESTFIDSLARGEVVPGLRAPSDGPPNISGSYSIAGIPDGKYVVLAAFENDGNVRDPDPNIAGTQIARVGVAGGVASANPTFKVTGAIEMVSPGAGNEVEAIAGTPTFTWKPYSSARSYELVVFNSQGVKIWENLLVPDLKNAAGNIAVDYMGSALKPGVVYQWRATARGQAANPISLTEDLKGLFSVK